MKLMLLGGSKYLLPYIEKAHELGIYVITCDYLPDNIAHRYSDEYCNVSIIDKDKVLQEARRLEIDGILSPATDPGVVSAAYVAEMMQLNGVPYKSACILQDKGMFRKFLKDNGFNVPNAICSSTYDGILKEISELKFPVIVKPVDSAGSKGVSRVDSMNDLEEAFDYAYEYSINGEVIIEEFIEKIFETSGSDSFSINNKLCFFSLDSQLFDDKTCNEYTPVAHVWPTVMPEEYRIELKNEVQRLIELLELNTSIYNIEARVGSDHKAYLMELAPRAGGNRIAEVLDMACNQHLIENSVRFAMGMELLPMSKPEFDNVWAEYIIHSNKDGILKKLEIKEPFKSRYVVEQDFWLENGSKVEKFTGANKSLGTIIMKFNDMAEAKYYLKNVSEWLIIEVA